MSDTGERNPALGGQENPVDDPGAGVWEAGAEDAVIRDSGPHGNEEAEGEGQAEAEARSTTGTGPGEAGVAGAMGGLDEEVTAARVPEGGVIGEDYNMAPAHDGEQRAEDPGPRLTFLDLVSSLLHRLYYNDHILMRPRARLRIVQPRSQMPIHVSGIRMPSVPQGSGAGTAAIMPQGSGEGAAAMVPEGSGVGAAAMTPEDQPEANVEEPAQKAEGPEGEEEMTKYQYESTEEEAEDAETKEENEELSGNKGPKRM